jgi:hypothetical protein
VALVAYTAMFALATLVEPVQREMVTVVPLHATQKKSSYDDETRTAMSLEQTRNARLMTTLENLRFPVR